MRRSERGAWSTVTLLTLVAAVTLGCAGPVESAVGASVPEARAVVDEPEILSLGEPCPAAPTLGDLHAALWLLERLDSRGQARQRIERARREVERDEVGPGWSSFAMSLAEAAEPDELSYPDVERLRLRLHESTCLQPDLHEKLHGELRDPLETGH